MREMVLNHASVTRIGSHRAVEWLPDVAEGMAALVNRGVTQSTLRMCQSLHEIQLQDGRSLFQTCQDLLQRDARDQYLFLMRLSMKMPLLDNLEQDTTDRFLMCEATTLAPNDGAPLLFCAVTDAIAVSMPSESVWDRDQIVVAFQELLPDETFDDAEEDIDNVARAVHVDPISDRHRERLMRRCSDMGELWNRRGQLFPHLMFGPDVENHVGKLNAGLLGTLVNRLADLDTTAATWAVAGGEAPPWTTKVTPESQHTMNNPKLREARRFRSASSELILFAWHARFGSGMRIHLRFDARSREIEVGYIGGHLPLS